MKLPVNYDATAPSKRRLVRIEYVKQQLGKCQHCGELLFFQPTQKVLDAYIKESLFPPGFFNNPVHLHHDHLTGMTIGAVHARCNAYLWQHLGE